MEQCSRKENLGDLHWIPQEVPAEQSAPSLHSWYDELKFELAGIKKLLARCAGSLLSVAFSKHNRLPGEEAMGP